VSTAPSGRQFEIAHGEQRVSVVEVGGGIREYTVGERAVLEPYPRDAICDGGHGAPLIPWPNRLAEGRYSFDGSDYRVELSEPARLNAIHGFMRWRPWSAALHEAHRVVMSATLHPLPAYPFALDLSIAYELGEDGLTVSTTATNVGAAACPYGTGQHPYLSPGAGLVDACTLQLPASTRILTDETRRVPVAREPVAGTSFDFREPRAVGEQRLDVGFTDLARDRSGRALVRLSGADGRTVELWLDERYEFVQLYSGDELARERRRTGLAVEPMTCPSNAFQSGDGLVRLEPGESLTTRWGARLSG
jgi:aldose 1-epimerase